MELTGSGHFTHLIRKIDAEREKVHLKIATISKSGWKPISKRQPFFACQIEASCVHSMSEISVEHYKAF